jgi:hypothetical protein
LLVEVEKVVEVVEVEVAVEVVVVLSPLLF